VFPFSLGIVGHGCSTQVLFRGDEHRRYDKLRKKGKAEFLMP
jgi:hypothetical protein